MAVHDAAQFIIEPKDLWTSRLKGADAAAAPVVVTLDDGTDAWQFDGGTLDPIGLEAAAGRGDRPLRNRFGYGDLDPGLTQAADRLRTMDREHIDEASIFPTYALNVLNIGDARTHLACVRAYNDAIVEWCADGDAERLHPHALIPVTGLDDATAELERAISLGMRGIVFGGWPSAQRTPTPDDDRFWAMCDEADIAVHLLRGGPTDPNPATRPHTPAAVGRYMGGTGAIEATVPFEVLVTDLVTTKNGNLSWFVLTGVLERFPALRIVMVQAGAGWLGTCGELLDWNYRYAQFVPGNGFAKLEDLPSEYIERQVYATVETDQKSLAFLTAHGGEHTCLWASAYPTSASAIPGAQDRITQQTAQLAQDEQMRLLESNYELLYSKPQ
jgi:predicted TIM-barrel fold metal-dependent hydrolase